MTLNTPLFLQAIPGDTGIPISAQDLRTLVDALILGRGVSAPGDLLVTQRAAGANFSVDIASGHGVIIGSSVADQGKYIVQNTATVNLAIAGAPGAGFNRLDLVYAQVRDRQADGGSSYDWVIDKVTGTTTNVLPATPANAIPLAQVGPIVNTTASITNSLITDLRAFFTLTGFRTKGASFAASGGTASAPFVGLTGGPQLTVGLFSGQTVEVTVSALASISGGTGHSAQMGFNVAGAGSQSPQTDDVAQTQSADPHTISRTSLYTAPATGSYTFDTRYGAVNGTTATFANRRLIVRAA